MSRHSMFKTEVWKLTQKPAIPGNSRITKFHEFSCTPSFSAPSITPVLVFACHTISEMPRRARVVQSCERLLYERLRVKSEIPREQAKIFYCADRQFRVPWHHTRKDRSQKSIVKVVHDPKHRTQKFKNSPKRSKINFFHIFVLSIARGVHRYDIWEFSTFPRKVRKTISKFFHYSQRDYCFRMTVSTLHECMRKMNIGFQWHCGSKTSLKSRNIVLKNSNSS